MSDSPEYEAMKDCVPRLRLAVKGDLVTISGELLAARLISEDKEASLRNKMIDEGERAAEMVSLIMDKVREDRGNYHVFLEILKQDHLRGRYQSIIGKLEEKFDMRKRASAGRASGTGDATSRSPERRGCGKKFRTVSKWVFI